MENNRRGGNGRKFEGRREYGSRNSSERRPRTSETGRSFDRPKRTFSDKGERKSFGDRKPFSRGGENRYGEGRSSEGRRNEGRSFEGRNFDRPRRTFSENGERRSFGHSGEGRHSEGRSFDRQKRTFSENGERKSFGNRKSFGGRKTESNGFGGKKSFYKKDFNYFRDEDESGINKMISRRPQADESRFSDNDMVNIPVKDEVRLNKYIANSGVCSRREADNFILAGVVTVNGEVVTELGTKVNIYTDDIRFNGERLKGESKIYIVMNKPKGYVTTASDPHADKTVMDLLKGCPSRVFPVGRLDKNTTGVLMFTNDGEIAEKLTHPSYDKKKIYQVSLDSKLRQEDFEQIMKGIELPDGMIAADDLEFIEEDDHRKVGIEIHSGKNRIVRRIFESLGYEVKALDRVYFAGLTKKGIKRGDWRYLSEGEINLLKMGAYL